MSVTILTRQELGLPIPTKIQYYHDSEPNKIRVMTGTPSFIKKILAHRSIRVRHVKKLNVFQESMF